MKLTRSETQMGHVGYTQIAGWIAPLARGRIRRATFGSLIRMTARAYARLELPRHKGLIERLIRDLPELWQRTGTRECRGLWHGCRLRLEMSDYYQRLDFYLRRYHDGPLQMLLWRVLRPGDTFVDGGANAGLVSMFAAWRVGPRGRVLAFEPNQTPRAQLEWHVRKNGLGQVRILPVGLSDQRCVLEFREPDPWNLGAGTFASIPRRYEKVAIRSYMARVVRGDDTPELAQWPGAAVVKLDVEGFEIRALHGLERFIERHRPLVITEINPEMLEMAGSSPEELWSFFESRGYRAFTYETRRAIVRQRRLVLTSVSALPHPPPTDLVWTHPDSDACARLGFDSISSRTLQPRSDGSSPRGETA